MVRRFALLFALVALVGAAVAPSAGAMDLGDLMAPPSVCPDQNDADAPAAVQEQAMQCMTNFARRSAGQATFVDVDALDRSASEKSSDILRCDSFSHYACGRDFTYWMQRVGYTSARCWRAGENIAWGTGSYATVRSIFKAWLHSPGHRENILGSYSQLGVGLQVGGLDGRSGAHVWTQHFGSHCGSVRARPHTSPHIDLAGASAVG
ncbi:MAG TPA: CAP domain-containing protein [Solirubrobacterales bacterium]